MFYDTRNFQTQKSKKDENDWFLVKKNVKRLSMIPSMVHQKFLYPAKRQHQKLPELPKVPSLSFQCCDTDRQTLFDFSGYTFIWFTEDEQNQL